MKIYQIDLDISDTSPRNILLIEAEAKYALLEEYDCIVDVTETFYHLYTENDEIILMEVDPDFDDAQDDCCCDEEDAEVSDEELVADSITSINLILSNSLRSSDKITQEQANTMLSLAHLRNILLGE